MKITDFIEGKVTYDKDGQYFWVNNANEGLQMLAELRGWGRIQNMFKSKGKYDLDGAMKFQDELGEWVASAINEKLQRESEQILLNKPAVINNEAVFCKDCGKYKKTQGNGIMHQLCECGSEVSVCELDRCHNICAIRTLGTCRGCLHFLKQTDC